MPQCGLALTTGLSWEDKMQFFLGVTGLSFAEAWPVEPDCPPRLCGWVACFRVNAEAHSPSLLLPSKDIFVQEAACGSCDFVA